MKMKALCLLIGFFVLATASLSAQSSEVKPTDIKKKELKKEKVTPSTNTPGKTTGVKSESKKGSKSQSKTGTKSEKGGTVQSGAKESVNQTVSGGGSSSTVVNPLTGKKPKTKKEKLELEQKAKQAAEEANSKKENSNSGLQAGVKPVSRNQIENFEDLLGKANFKILGFTLACKVNGVIKSYKSLNGLVSSEMKKAISQLKKGEQFTLENIKIYTRKGVEKTIPKQVYQLID